MSSFELSEQKSQEVTEDVPKVTSNIVEYGKEYSCFDNVYYMPDTRIYIKTLYYGAVQISQTMITPVQVLMLLNIPSVILQKGATYEVAEASSSSGVDSSSMRKHVGAGFKSKVTLERISTQGRKVSTDLSQPTSPVSASSLDSPSDDGQKRGFLKKLTKSFMPKGKDNGNNMVISTKLESTKEGSLAELSLSSPSYSGSKSAVLQSAPPLSPSNVESPNTTIPSDTFEKAQSTMISYDTSKRLGSTSVNVSGPNQTNTATVGLPSSWEMKCEGWLRIYHTDTSASEPLWFRLESDHLNGYSFKDSKTPKVQIPIPTRCISFPFYYQGTENPTPNVWPFKMMIWKSDEVIISFVTHTEQDMVRWISHLNSYMINRMALAYMNGFEFTPEGQKQAFKSDPTMYYRKELKELVIQLNAGLADLKPNFEFIAMTTTMYDTSVAYGDEAKRSMPKGLNNLKDAEKPLHKYAKISDLKISIEEKHVRWAYNLLDGVKNPTKNINFAIHPTQVIEKLTDDQHGPEEEYVESFLLVFRHWFTPVELLQQLIDRYRLTLAGDEDAQAEHLLKWRAVIRIRTVTFLKRWIDSCWSDFSKENARQMLNDFVNMIQTGNMSKFGQSNSTFAEEGRVRSDMRKVGELLKIYIEAVEGAKANDNKRHDSSASKKTKIEFSDIANEKEIADELTLKDFEKYKKLQPLEFFIHAWSKKSELIEKPELDVLMEMIESFNTISYWTATEVCTRPDVKQRAKIIEKMILLAKEFKRLNNFNALLAVVSGLNTASVQRLKSTWELVQQKYTHALSDLEDFVNPQNNFKRYRETLASLESEWLGFWERKLLGKPTINASAGAGPMAASVAVLSAGSPPQINPASPTQAMSMANIASPGNKPNQGPSSEQTPEPAIPIISLFLKDLTFLSDGNPKFYEGSKLFNYGKAKTMFSYVQRILLFQLGSYAGLNPSDDVKEFCQNLRALNEEALYKYSKLNEGKDTDARLINKWTHNN